MLKTRVLVFHEKEYFAKALALALSKNSRECKPFHKSGQLIKAMKKKGTEALIICEERTEELTGILNDVFINHKAPRFFPTIALFTFCSRFNLKKTLAKNRLFPELSACMRMGLIHHFQLPAKIENMGAAVNRMLKARGVKDLSQAIEQIQILRPHKEPVLTFDFPNLSSLKILCQAYLCDKEDTAEADTMSGSGWWRSSIFCLERVSGRNGDEEEFTLFTEDVRIELGLVPKSDLPKWVDQLFEVLDPSVDEASDVTVEVVTDTLKAIKDLIRFK